MTKPKPKFASASQISNSQILNPGTAAALEILPPVLPATHYSLPATLPIDLSASINAAFATARTAAITSA